MPRLTVTGTNIDAPDANALADFYRRLLGWTTRTEEPGWVVIQPGASDQARGGTLSFQTESRYVRPVWPAGPGDQQMMMHLEIKVDDLEASVAHAVAQARRWPDSSRKRTCGSASIPRDIPSACTCSSARRFAVT